MEFIHKKILLDYKPKFSILIPSWNNLEYLQLCVKSIRKNSSFQHQIIVHINEGNDGTENWVQNQKDISYTKSSQNSGVCYGFNAASHLADSEYLVFLDDDLYLCPQWDYYFWEEIQKITDYKWCISGTMIEPAIKGMQYAIRGKKYGENPKEFEEERFLLEYKSFPFNDWTGSQWYPMVLPTFAYRLVGGLSVEFSPGMYSDPDFMVKLWHLGIRYYKGLSKSRAYHFGSRSTGRVKRNDGRSQFIAKWGFSSNTFFKNYLKMGSDFNGVLSNQNEDGAMLIKKRFDRWKIKLKSITINF
jgi:glycosyltransferase involved in cell wall biosynthesis